MDFGAARKRGKPDAAFNGNGGFKKPKREMESFPTGIGSKSKPCTKFFSTVGCQFGESCHFMHYVPGGIKAVTQMLGGNSAVPSVARNSAIQQPFSDVSSPTAVKTRMCNKYNTAEGCRFGDKCHFAHGEWELGKPGIQTSYEDPRAMAPPMGGRFGSIGGRMELPPVAPPAALGAAASFGASATAKISIAASLAGGIIGKGGVNSKQICRVTGAKLSIRDHESDPNLKNIELEGTFDQIKQASAMVRELILNTGSTASGPAVAPPPPVKNASVQVFGPASNNYKTKLCENFAKGSCTFGDRCHFAHGADELRKSSSA